MRTKAKAAFKTVTVTLAGLSRDDHRVEVRSMPPAQLVE